MPSAKLALTPNFIVAPLPVEFVQRVRATLRDDFARAVSVRIAQGGEPMRDQLRRANPGERIILCSYQAIGLPSEFAEIGPIYISADQPARQLSAGELPTGYFNRTFALRAYDARDRIAESALVEPENAANEFSRLLGQQGIAFLHARFAGHGCFAAHIQRAA